MKTPLKILACCSLLCAFAEKGEASLLVYDQAFIEGTDTLDFYVEGKNILNRDPDVLGFADTVWTRTGTTFWNTFESSNLTYANFESGGGGFNMNGTPSGRFSRDLSTSYGDGTYWFSFLMEAATPLAVATIGVEIGPSSGAGALFLGNRNGQFAVVGDTTDNMAAADVNVNLFMAKLEVDSTTGTSVSVWLSPDLAGVTQESDLGVADGTTTLAGLTSFDNINFANFSGVTSRDITLDEIRLGTTLASVIPEPSSGLLLGVSFAGLLLRRRLSNE